MRAHEKTEKAMWNREFQYFLNQHLNVYLEKDERQALRTRKHYIQIFFGWFYWYFHEISMFQK